MRDPIQLLRRVAVLEGISFLALLGLAMPLKYMWGMPMAVRIVGLAHGILFLLFCAALTYVSLVAKWPKTRSAMVFLAGFVPFGPWLVDRRLNEYQAEFARSRKT